MLLQGLQIVIADGGRSARYLVGKMDYALLFFVEQLAAMIEPQRQDLLVGDSNPLRRSGMSFASILAAVYE